MGGRIIVGPPTSRVKNLAKDIGFFTFILLTALLLFTIMPIIYLQERISSGKLFTPTPGKGEGVIEDILSFIGIPFGLFITGFLIFSITTNIFDFIKTKRQEKRILAKITKKLNITNGIINFSPELHVTRNDIKIVRDERKNTIEINTLTNTEHIKSFNLHDTKWIAATDKDKTLFIGTIYQLKTEDGEYLLIPLPKPRIKRESTLQLDKEGNKVTAYIKIHNSKISGWIKNEGIENAKRCYLRIEADDCKPELFSISPTKRKRKKFKRKLNPQRDVISIIRYDITSIPEFLKELASWSNKGGITGFSHLETKLTLGIETRNGENHETTINI